MKKEIFEYIKKKLSTDKSWQIKSLIAIYNRQTPTEKNSEKTIIHNSIGFTGADAELLTSFAKQWQSRNWLSDKQLLILARRMRKYWHQIYEISDKKKLELLIEKEQPMLQFGEQLTLELK